MEHFEELKIVIENPKGTHKAFRRKTAGDPAWKDYPLTGVTYPVDYGYVEGFVGEDGMGLDVFVGSGDRFGLIRVYRIDVPSETKFLVRLTKEEHDAILREFKPVLLENELFSERIFMEALERFRA